MDQERVGIVRCVWPHRGYAFLLDTATGEEIFFHRDDLNGRPFPSKGATVRFTPGTFKGRKKASNVRVVSNPAEGAR